MQVAVTLPQRIATALDCMQRSATWGCRVAMQVYLLFLGHASDCSQLYPNEYDWCLCDLTSPLLSQQQESLIALCSQVAQLPLWPCCCSHAPAPSGLQQPEAGLDMLIVHVDTHTLLEGQEQQQQQQQQVAATAAAVLSWLDLTLRYLNNSKAFKDVVLLSVLATAGAAGALPAAASILADQAGGQQIRLHHWQMATGTDTATTNSGNTSSSGNADTHSTVAQGQQLLRPLQSWQQLGGVPLNIDMLRSVLCMRRLPGVIRRDDCDKFTLQQCCSNTGVLGLVIDRLIPEIAYKLGRAPKYGA